MTGKAKDTLSNGGCLCGKVTYTFTGEPRWVAHCHCQSCRRNTASPVTTFVGVANERYQFTGSTPAVFESSPGVRRHFCANCGTPIAYEADRYADEIHFYLVGLTDPAAFVPTKHVHYDERVDWFDVHDALPRYAPTPVDPTDTDTQQSKHQLVSRGPQIKRAR